MIDLRWQGVSIATRRPYVPERFASSGCIAGSTSEDKALSIWI
jgi:hypothetical protein